MKNLGMPMKKKTRATPLRGAKRRKAGLAERKALPQRTRLAKKAASVSRKSTAPAPDAKPTIRRLKVELAQPLPLSGQLQPSPNPAFPWAIPNRAGFQR